MRVLVTIVSVFLSSIGALAESNSPPSAFDFMKTADFTHVELSPSGQYIAFVMTDTQKHCLDVYGQAVPLGESKCKEKNKHYRTGHTLVMYDLDVGKVVNTIGLQINVSARWLEWAGDDRLLAALSVPTTFGGNGRGYSLGGARVVSFSLDSADYTVLFDNQNGVSRRNRYLSRITNMLRSDPEHIIMPANRNGDLDLWKVSTITGSAERLALGTKGTFYWFTDNAGNPKLRFDCKGRRCRRIDIFAPSKTDVDEWEKIKSFKIKPNSDEDDFDFWPIAPAEKDGQYYVISNEEGDPRRAIKIYDLESREYVETVFEHETMDVGGPILDLQTGGYAGAWLYEDRLRYVFVDPELQTHFDALDKYFGATQNIRSLGFNSAGTKLIIFVSGVNNPGEYYIYDFKNTHVDRLFQSRPNLGERLPSETEIRKIKTRDGQSITAYHTFPKGMKKGEAQLLVMPHGGPEVRDYFDYDSRVQYFVTRGYQILQVNYRGSSGYGRKFAEAGYGQWGGDMQNDVIDTVQNLYDAGYARPDNTCMVGYSYGGYVALYAGAKTPDMFACIVSGGGVADIWTDLHQSRTDYGEDSETYAYWVKSMGTKGKSRSDLKALSPRYMADQFTAPVLLTHGSADGIVYSEQSEKMRNALKRAGKDVEYLKLQGEGHNGWSLENNILYHETIEAFLEKHLK